MAATLQDFLASNNGQIGNVISILQRAEQDYGRNGAGITKYVARDGIDPSLWAWYDTVTKGKTADQISADAQAKNAASAAETARKIASGELTPEGLTPAEVAQNKVADAAYAARVDAQKGGAPAPAAVVDPTNPERQTNIINPATGEKGYQTPGAPIPPGWQAIGGSSAVSSATPGGANPSAGSVAGASTPAFPTEAIQPGATGDSVKQLQDYLVSKGYLTQAQVNTGYGTYGPQTTAAVKRLQADLGVDNTSGPGSWGPKTVAALGTDAASKANGPAVNTPHDASLAELLGGNTLTPDQKQIVQQLYDAVSTNDQAKVDKLKAAFSAATDFSEPYFKAQVLIATDALDRALGANEGDLGYQEEKLQNTLKDLLGTIDSSKEYLSFGNRQELEGLARSYEKNLEDTRTNLAALGKTSSSVRSKSEQILGEENKGLVESSNRKLAFDTNKLDTQGANAVRDTSRDISYLRDKATQDRISALRKTEADVGSKTLQDLGYTDLLSGLPGEIERKKVQDAASFSNSFVF